MIILITDVLDDVNENTHTVTFQIVDGAPCKNDIERLLIHEINQCSDITYSSLKKQGQFKTLGRQCVQGEHFNDAERYEVAS